MSWIDKFIAKMIAKSGRCNNVHVMVSLSNHDLKVLVTLRQDQGDNNMEHKSQ
jgi:hypothetical protein